MKALLKLALFVLLGTTAAGVVMITKKPGTKHPISYDIWPEVPRNTAK